MGITTRLINNADMVKREMEQAVSAALEAIGQQAETHAKQNLAKAGRVDNGDLMNSIAHEVHMSEDAVYVGTDKKHGIYNEFGTGIHGDKPTSSGDKTWWVYVPGSESKNDGPKGKRYTKQEAYVRVLYLRSKGIDAHMTQGMKPTHFLRNAAADHTDEYKKIVEAQLKKG